MMTEFKAGAPVETHALVMSSQAYRENDKILHLMTKDFGKISVIALSSQRSIKRFGGSLEPLTHIRAHLVVPREGRNSSESPIWRLERCEFVQSFAHFRKNYAALECGTFALKLVMDHVPDSTPENEVFQALGRFLRDSENVGFDRDEVWCRTAFWTWFSHHMGFGDLTAIWEKKLSWEKSEAFWQLWHECLAAQSPDFKKLFDRLSTFDPPRIAVDQERQLYENWLALSGIHWEYWEKCLRRKLLA